MLLPPRRLAVLQVEMNLLLYSVWLSPKDIDSDGFLRHYYVMRNTRNVVYEVKEKHFSDPPVLLRAGGMAQPELTADR
jgi:hypothetical protein